MAFELPNLTCLACNYFFLSKRMEISLNILDIYYKINNNSRGCNAPVCFQNNHNKVDIFIF